MRLRSLTVAGFRGYGASVTFDLDGDAVIVSGANGSGKTSMFDAILWALTGSVGRLDVEEAELVSKYSPSGEARVELTLVGHQNEALRVVRRFDGESHLSVGLGRAEMMTGPSAEAALLERLWPDAKVAPEPWDALSRSLTRATYLQQDAVRDFVESDGEEGRFNVVSEIIGAGRVTELQRQLETGRRAWSRTTNEVEREVEALRQESDGVASRLARLEDSNREASDLTEWDSWAAQVGEIRPLERDDLATPDPEALDRALTGLLAAERHAEREAVTVEELQRLVADVPPAGPPLEPLQDAVVQSQADLRRANEALADAQQEASARRRLHVQEQDRAQSLQTLSRIALEHLGERCPVCDQTYDEVETRRRLERLTHGDVSRVESDDAGVDRAAALVEEAEQAAAQADAALRAAEQQRQTRTRWEAAVQSLVADLGLDGIPSEEEVRDLLGSLRTRMEKVRQLRERGDSLNLRLARSAEVAQRNELTQQLEELEAAYHAKRERHTAMAQTGDEASQLIEGLRDAGRSLVIAELERIEPVLQRIYATVDPHPSFRAVRFLTKTVRGRGRLWTTVGDRAAPEVTSDRPSIVLSSSQLNVLAVSAFLSLNLGVESLPLEVVALDDPLQTLDTVNLLGLADLLRRVRSQRQVIVSTHDQRLADLLTRKLRPVHAHQATKLVRLSGWTPEGPSIDQSDVPTDPRPLRLVASAS